MVCVWGSFWGGGVVSSFSPPARRGVGYCWASSGVASVPLPAAPAVFHGVSCRRLPLGGSAPFLTPVACSAPAVELCCWVCGVLGASLGFLPGVVLFLRGLRLALLTLPQVTLGGCCLFWRHLPDLLLRWWRRLGGNPSLSLSVLLLRRLACRGSLVSVPCVRGLPWGCDYSLDNNLVVLFDATCL